MTAMTAKLTKLSVGLFCCCMAGAQGVETHIGNMRVFLVWENEACAPSGYGARFRASRTSDISAAGRTSGMCIPLEIESVLRSWNDRPHQNYELHRSDDQVQLTIESDLREALNRTATRCANVEPEVDGRNDCMGAAAVFLFDLREGAEVELFRAESRVLGEWSNSAEAPPVRRRWITHCNAIAIAPINDVRWKLTVGGQSLQFKFVNP